MIAQALFSPLRTLTAVLALSIGVLAPQPAAADDADATITLRGRTATVGAGFTWGGGTVEYQGKTYPVRIDGFVVGSMGSASLEAHGNVYELEKIEDLNGDYTALAGSAVLGKGSGSIVMRNANGVRIEMDADAAGFSLGIGPRGFTLAVGEAGGPPAETGPMLPPTLGFGEIQIGPIFARPTLNAQMYMAVGRNAGFDGNWSVGPIDDADDYFETSNEIGMNLRYPLGDEGRYGTLQGRVSGVFSLTASGPDGPVCNGSQNVAKSYTLESGYLAWKSGDVFPQLGQNAVELSAGNQNYQVFDGLLFWDGGSDCGGRGANWLSPRKAFQETGLLRLNLGDFVIDGVHLKGNDHPDSRTRLGAARVEYATDDLYFEHLKLGAMYFNIYHSEIETRNGMDGIYLYNEATPLPSLPGLSYKAAFVRESNSQSSALSSAYAWYVAPSYQFLETPWKPQIIFRYASLSGGSDQAFDSLYTGLPEWGSWFQGELLGEYVLSNSNLNSYQARLILKPSDVFTFNLIYYHFMLDDKDQAYGVTPLRVDKDLADEVDLILDIAPANWWSITATFSVAAPSKGFRQAVDGGATWINGYLYMNFNF